MRKQLWMRAPQKRIIKKHYKRPVMLEDAERYFSIRPASEVAGKVIAIGAA